MPPMYPIWPDSAGMFIDPAPAKPDAAALHDALTRAVSRNDLDGARSLFDRAFWHKTPFKPDWFHLYIAVQNENRPMVKLLTAYGATWTADQTRFARHALGAKCDAFKVLLRGAGIHMEAADKDMTPVAPQFALEMNKRILDENRKAGHNISAEEKIFLRNVHVEMANAVLQNDMPRALSALQLHPDAHNPAGHDVSDIFAEVLGDLMHASGKRAILFIDRLQNAGVRLQPVNLDRISGLTLPQHYDLLPQLEKRGLLQDDVKKLRRDMFDSWTFMQEEVELEDYTLRIPEDVIAKSRAQLETAAAVICTPHARLDAQEVEYFLRRHDRQAPRAPKAVAQMDAALLKTGFFAHSAFTAENLRHLAATQGLETGIVAAFNKIAAQREIGGHGTGYFLHRKRFAVLEKAMADGAFIPDRVETENIVAFLAGRMKKEEPSADIIQSLKILKSTGADFGRVRHRDYLGMSKPGMAKALLDLDIIEPRDINNVRLRKRAGAPVSLLQALDAADRHYAMREFAHQVALEKADPAQYKPYRAQKNVSYQKLYRLRQLKSVGSGLPHRAATQPARLPQILADHQRRAARENRQRQENLRKILQEARDRNRTKLDGDRENLRRILEDHRRLKGTEQKKMRKLMQEALKRQRGNNRFGY